MERGLKGWQQYFEFMREEEKYGQSCILDIGDVVKLTKDIWDDGEDHHPAAVIALAGENVFVRRIGDSSLGVAHAGVTDSSFTIYPGEYIVL